MKISNQFRQHIIQYESLCIVHQLIDSKQNALLEFGIQWH